MEAIETRLREVGVLDHDIRTRLNGPDKALLVTQRELVYADESGVQRTDLRDITKVATTSSGALSVRSAGGSSIEGSIRGFDVTELKFFFESVKTSVAQAKATLTSPPKLEGGSAVDPWDELPNPKLTSPGVMPAAINGATSTLNGASAALNGVPAAQRLNGASNGAHLNGASKEPVERQTLELPPLDPAALSRLSDPGLTARAETPRVADSGVFSPRATGEIPPSMPVMAPRASQEVPPRRMDVRYGEGNTPKADALGYALPENQLETGSLGAVKAPSVVPSSNDWSGEAFDPKVSLETRTPSSITVSPTLVESAASLKPLARWLRVLAGIFILAGLGMAASTVPGEKDPVMTWAYPVFYLLGSFLLSVLSFGVAELLSVTADIAADVRATLRITLKN